MGDQDKLVLWAELAQSVTEAPYIRLVEGGVSFVEDAEGAGVYVEERMAKSRAATTADQLTALTFLIRTTTVQGCQSLDAYRIFASDRLGALLQYAL